MPFFMSENFFKSSFQILVQNLNLIANEYIELNKSFKNRKLHDLDIEKSKYLSLLENNNINHNTRQYVKPVKTSYKEKEVCK